MAISLKVFSVLLLIATGGFWIMWIINGPSFLVVIQSFCAPIIAMGCWKNAKDYE